MLNFHGEIEYVNFLINPVTALSSEELLIRLLKEFYARRTRSSKISEWEL